MKPTVGDITTADTLSLMLWHRFGSHRRTEMEVPNSSQSLTHLLVGTVWSVWLNTALAPACCCQQLTRMIRYVRNTRAEASGEVHDTSMNVKPDALFGWHLGERCWTLSRTLERRTSTRNLHEEHAVSDMASVPRGRRSLRAKGGTAYSPRCAVRVGERDVLLYCTAHRYDTRVSCRSHRTAHRRTTPATSRGDGRYNWKVHAVLKAQL